MAFSITYRPLFEIRIVHGYYLPDVDDFLNAGATQNDILRSVAYNIQNDVALFPTDACQRLMDGHHMIFKPTALGATIWIETEQRDTGNAYYPVIPIAAETAFDFKLRLKEPYWGNRSRFRLRPNVKAKYYFSNWKPLASIAYPSLALAPGQYLEGRQYEMGEMVENGSVFVAQEDVDGTPTFDTSKWEAEDNLRYVNDQNQQLLAKKFWYYFTPNSGNQIQNPTFILWSDTVEIKRATITGTIRTKRHYLDFSDVNNGFYQLEVFDDNDYQHKKSIYLHDGLFDSQDWGLISIGQAKSSDFTDHAYLADFRLLEDQGDLPASTPVFELRIKNRATYWRYKLNPADEPQFNTIDYLDPAFDLESVGKTIISKDPIALNQYQVPPKLYTNTISDLPLPTPYDQIIKPIDGKVYSDIFLHKLNL